MGKSKQHHNRSRHSSPRKRVVFMPSMTTNLIFLRGRTHARNHPAHAGSQLAPLQPLCPVRLRRPHSLASPSSQRGPGKPFVSSHIQLIKESRVCCCTSSSRRRRSFVPHFWAWPASAHGVTALHAGRRGAPVTLNPAYMTPSGSVS